VDLGHLKALPTKIFSFFNGFLLFLNKDKDILTLNMPISDNSWDLRS